MFKNSIFAINVAVLEDPGVFDACYQVQRPERRERVDRMRFDTGKRLCLGAGVVMEHALAFAGCGDKDVVITPEGKPTVEGCFFNISHTDKIAICAVSDREVGVDIERSDRNLTESVIKKAFTPAEIQMCREDRDRFIRLWTIKESVMKWYGLGLGLMPEYIDVVFSENSDVRITISDPNHTDLSSQADTLRFTCFKHEDYKISVCSAYEKFAESITWINCGLK